MSAIDDVLATIKIHEVRYVDFRFTDPRGAWQHLAHHVRTVTPEQITETNAHEVAQALEQEINREQQQNMLNAESR